MFKADREQWRFGSMYRFGIGVKEDQEKAVEWFRKSAEQGHAVGQYFLACAYQEGEGVPQNFAEARAWFSLSKSNGDEDAEERMDDLDAKMIKEDISKSQERARELQAKIDDRNSQN